MATRRELIDALQVRYDEGATTEKTAILDEFATLTGYHRKHAIRVLGCDQGLAPKRRTRNLRYDEAVRQALILLWEAGDRVCGKWLKALIPTLIDAMERHGHLDLDPVVRVKLLQVSAATIRHFRTDRILSAEFLPEPSGCRPQELRARWRRFMESERGVSPP